MSDEISKISFGRKLILIGAAHLSLNSALLLLGKEFFLEAVPAAKVMFMQETISEILQAVLISMNTLPLTLGIAYIVYNWKGFTGYKLLSASVVLWICLFLGSWLHLGIKHNELFTVVRLRDYMTQGGTNAFIQLLTYPFAAFFTVYGYAMFFTSVLVGWVAGSSLPKPGVAKEKPASIKTGKSPQH